MDELFFEIFSEEIPARMQKFAQEQLKTLINEALEEYKIGHGHVNTYITPRRMVGHITDIASASQATIERVKGPQVTLSDDIIERFKNSNSGHEIIQDNGYYYAIKTTPEKPIDSIIPQILHKLFHKFEWPKRMRWPESSIEWVRPVRRVYCFYKNAPITFSMPYLGIETSEYVTGHRFLSEQHILPISFDDYKQQLKENYVILDREERKSMMLLQNQDQDLLEENAGLVEYPFMKKGKIDKTDLPLEVITCVMKMHQKYFTSVNEAGVVDGFYVVANIDSHHMIAGYERVLRARLKDAEFFYQEDLKTSLSHRMEKLEKIVVHKNIGSVADKVRRLEKIPGLEEISLLCKADLTTHMVYEFPELQGVMGSIYGKKQNISQTICTAIWQHYFPLGPDTPLPDSELGRKLAFYDKLDTLVGLIGTGIKFSSSKDPLGLRRAALGIIRLVDACNFDLEEAMETLKPLYSKPVLPNTSELVLDFIKGRIKILYGDTIALSNYRKVSEILQLIPVLESFCASETGKTFLEQYKRLCNLIKKFSPTQDLDQLIHDGEKTMIDFLKQDFTLDDLITITPKLKEYFDTVMVLQGDDITINQRMNLLNNFKEKVDLKYSLSAAI